MMDNIYQKEALKLRKEDISTLPGSVGWESPSNIALVKYWGKKDTQKPINPSLSMTLSHMSTRTEVHYTRTRYERGKRWFSFNGEKNHPFGARIIGYLEKLEPFFPFLAHMDLHIVSTNSFPHSAGMASSASAMSALALCICSIEQRLRDHPTGAQEFYRKASYMARLGSGSAARSVYGPFVEWGDPSKGSDEYAQPLEGQVNPALVFLHDSVMITSGEPKKVKSSQGHRRMEKHPYHSARIQQALDNQQKIRKALARGDFQMLAEATEEEALSLHALMLSSRPGFILINQATINIIQAIRDFRDQTGARITFTLDAGPNVHVIYPTDQKEAIREWMQQTLAPYCENGKMIHDFTGKGPEQLDLNRND
jgi:diphosphomevalonate decarboxylase